MRNSGFHFLHHWRVLPSKADALGNITFTVRIDGEPKGNLKAGNMADAILEAKKMIEAMMEKSQS